MSESTIDGIPVEPECGGTVKLFDVKEYDLAELERILPQFVRHLESLPYYNDKPKIRVQIRRIQQILMNIRWNYGPAGEVHFVDE